MKSTHLSLALLAMVLLIAFVPASRAEDWKTIDGKVYQNVKVLHCDPDAVTILYKDGGGVISLELLPDDLQKRFHYDPKAAKAAADARMQQEIADAHALRAEQQQFANQKKEEDEETARYADSAAVNSPAAVETTASSGTHQSIDDLIANNSLHRDLSDPTYHTMAHLVTTIHSLRPDPTDPNHHSINDATNPSP